MAINPGENFRKKLVVVLNKFGTPVNRYRPAYTDTLGTEHLESKTTVKVLDTDDIKKSFVDVSSFFDVGGLNQNNAGMIELIYAAEGGTVGPEARFKKALIDEGDELHLGGYVYKVERQKGLPIAGVMCFRHLTCTRLREL